LRLELYLPSILACLGGRRFVETNLTDGHHASPEQQRHRDNTSA
jgi:hypothetical protein